MISLGDILKYKKDGIPILKDDEIENIAYDLLREFDSSILINPIRLPVAEILTYLEKTYDLKVNITKLGSKNGMDILGRTMFSKNTICIDENIVNNNEPLFLSTVAHEIGHWVLHRHKPILKEQPTEIMENIDDDRNNILPSARRKLITTLDWMEHHAKVFGASLLMPRESFTNAVLLIQQNIGVSRNLGIIYYDHQRGSERDYRYVKSELQRTFRTSEESIHIRLKELGILQDKLFFRPFQ